jgi:hypothetical protein
MLLVVLIGIGGAHGQAVGVGPAAVETVVPEAVPAIASFGVQFGFPADRTVSATPPVQARFAGLVLRAGGGPGGVSLGHEGRAYPPGFLTGREITAAGEAELDLRRDGCRWVRTGPRC